ncbi:MAG: rhodanese-like domain-containing protein [Pseudomonadota bacterium]|nr:rhodanese-like domain-containing protein [Pseudomonadota bacterium]
MAPAPTHLVMALEGTPMTRFQAFVFSTLLAAAAPSMADLSVLVAVEPTSKKDGFLLSRTGLEAGLGKAVGQTVTAKTSDDLTDAMRVTRSGGYDVFMAPPQVAASALAHGYELIGSTELSEQFVLVGKQRHKSTSAIKGGKIYLPQQDSIYAYMARGMLNASGLSFKDMGAVQYERYPQAGLIAVSIGTSDATVVRRGDWDVYQKENPGAASLLATSGNVPGGFSVVIKKDLPADVREKAARWFTGSTGVSGMKATSIHAEAAEYKAVAELGIFTPLSLPGAKVVSAAEVQQLASQGAVIIDARNDKEYRAAHLPNAVLVPYVEKSLKDVAYDASLDQFVGLDKFDKSKPIIFGCNGAECWKSYKASKSALQQGFKHVYWFRGGLPEWQAAGLAVARS